MLSASSGPTKRHAPGWRTGRVQVRPVGRWTLAHRPVTATSSRTWVTCTLPRSWGDAPSPVGTGLTDGLCSWLFTAETPCDLRCRKGSVLVRRHQPRTGGLTPRYRGVRFPSQRGRTFCRRPVVDHTGRQTRTQRRDSGRREGRWPMSGGGGSAFRRRVERAAELRSIRASGSTVQENDELSAAEEELRQKRAAVDDAAKAEYLIRDAMAQGKFDNLKYAGKPIPGLGEAYDPDWWVKGLIQRENLTGLGPKAILLRAEDAELDGTIDAQ